MKSTSHPGEAFVIQENSSKGSFWIDMISISVGNRVLA